MTRISRKEYFMEIAKLVAKRSPCLSRQVGAVITYKNRVISTGYNGVLPGNKHCVSCKRNEVGKDLHQCLAIHAEANAILEAIKNGFDLEKPEITMYCTVEPCIECTKLIAWHGISNIIYLTPYRTSDNMEKLISENGIEKEQYGQDKH